jgi:hypothetical protein
MIRRIRNDSILEEYDPMPASYWQRNKKPNIDLNSDSPFASDRQLEDQRFSMMKNRVSRFHDIFSGYRILMIVVNVRTRVV